MKESIKSTISGLVILDFMRTSGSKKIIKQGGLFFNWGILWSIFVPLIYVLAFSLIFGAGLRGSGVADMESFVFILFLFFNFREIVNDFVMSDDEIEFFKQKRYINYLILLTSQKTRILIQSFIRLILVIIVMNFLNYKIYFLPISICFFIMFLLAIYFGLIASSIIGKNIFGRTIFQFFLFLILIISDVIVPFEIWPEQIIQYLLYNPIVHLNGYLKSTVSNVYFDYIDLRYSIEFFVLMFFSSLIFINIKISKFREYTK